MKVQPRFGSRRDLPPRGDLQRQESLRELGFETYRKYLATDLWCRIKSRVLTRHKARCACCGRKAKIVHHRQYDVGTLNGTDLQWLVAVCGRCHKRIEFSGDQKRTDLVEKDRILMKMITKKGLSRLRRGHKKQNKKAAAKRALAAYGRILSGASNGR